MKEGGHFYVCGDVGMASDVTTTLSKIIQEHGKMTSEQAQSYLLKLKVRFKIIFDNATRTTFKRKRSFKIICFLRCGHPSSNDSLMFSSIRLFSQESNRFHEDIFGVTVKAEATDRARDQAKKAWKYINSTNKATRTDEVVTRIPSAVIHIYICIHNIKFFNNKHDKRYIGIIHIFFANKFYVKALKTIHVL